METTRIINLSFQLWGSLLTLIIIFCLLGAKKFKEKGEKLYLAMLACNMVCMLMDAAALYFRGQIRLIVYEQP